MPTRLLITSVSKKCQYTGLIPLRKSYCGLQMLHFLKSMFKALKNK